MAFTEDFTNSGGATQNLTARAGWSLIAGNAGDAYVGAGSSALSGSGSGEYQARCTGQGSADHRTTVVQTGVDNSFITIRETDKDNWIGYRNRDGNYQVFKRVAGTFTQLGTDYAATPSSGSPATVVIEGEGDQIRFTVNGTARCGSPFTETFNQTAQGQGIHGRPDAGAAEWLTTFVAEAVGAAAAPVLSTPTHTLTAINRTTAGATIDSGGTTGTLYALARTGGSQASISAIKTGGQSNATTGTGAKTVPNTVLAAGTANQYVDLVYNDATNGDSNVVTVGPITTASALSFSGTVSAQSVVSGTVVDIDLSTFFSGTGFGALSYASIGTALTGTGLSLNTSTGHITGTAGAVTSVPGVQVRKSDSGSPASTAQTNTFNLVISAGGVTFSGSISSQFAVATLPFVHTGSTIDSLFSGAGTYSEPAGLLAGAGLAISPTTGAITGSNPVVGTYNIVIRKTATSGSPATADSNSFTITVTPLHIARNLNKTVSGRRPQAFYQSGVLGSVVPSTGTDGPSYLYPTVLANPVLLNQEIKGRISSSTLPAGSWFAWNDGRLQVNAGVPDGAYTLTWSLEQYDVLQAGVGTINIAIGVVPPSISVQPTNQTVAVGATATMSVTAGGTAPLTYQWKRQPAAGGGFSDIAGANASSYTTPITTITGGSANNGDQYEVTITNPYGNVTSAVATLTVNGNAPAISTQPSNQSVVVGATATFSAAATGTAPVTYQWYRQPAAGGGFVAISGANSSSYTTPTTTVSGGSANNGDQYRITATNAYGSATSVTVTLTVSVGGVAPSISAQPANQSVSVGSVATLSVTTTGTAPITYQWYRQAFGTSGFVAISGANSSTYNTPVTTVSGGSANNGDQYQVVATNAYGSVTSATALLVVSPGTIVTYTGVTLGIRRVGITADGKVFLIF